MTDTQQAHTQAHVDVDVVIVGASFAGLSCASSLLQRGHSVIILEKRKSLAHKVHTTGIIVHEAVQEWSPPSQHLLPINKVSLYSPSLSRLDLTHPNYFFHVADVAEVWQHAYRKLADQYGDALELRCATAFHDYQQEGQGFVLPEHHIKTRYIIGADGPHSNVAKAAGLSQNKRFLVGTELELDAQSSEVPDRFHCFVHAKLCKGYLGWVIPGPGRIQVGLAVTKRQGIDLDAFIEHIKPVYPVNKSDVIQQKAGVIPTNGLLPHIHKPGILLIGDAAGWVSPLTGGGIHTAMRYGRSAGQTIADIFEQPEQERRYIQHFYKTLPRFTFKHALRFGFEHLTQNWMMEAALRLPGISKFANEVFFRPKQLA